MDTENEKPIEEIIYDNLARAFYTPIPDLPNSGESWAIIPHALQALGMPEEEWEKLKAIKKSTDETTLEKIELIEDIIEEIGADEIFIWNADDEFEKGRLSERRAIIALLEYRKEKLNEEEEEQ